MSCLLVLKVILYIKSPSKAMNLKLDPQHKPQQIDSSPHQCLRFTLFYPENVIAFRENGGLCVDFESMTSSGFHSDLKYISCRQENNIDDFAFISVISIRKV